MKRILICKKSLLYLKKAFFTAIIKRITLFYNIKYLTVIAGFVAFLPFSTMQISGSFLPFTVNRNLDSYLNRETAILVAQTNVSPYSASNVGINDTYERYVTAYSSTPEETDDTPFITASGSYVHFGIVAANWLPIGTAIRIPEYFGSQIFIVEDRMNSKHPNKIDVWLPSQEEAFNFGKRITKIEVL